jgi:hypothetical protein
MAVASRERGVDPVGACVGMKGSRVQAVVRELHGEKIDIISWTEDPQRFIAEALSPAEIDRVGISEAEGSAVVIVRDDQLSLAIGKKGQNVRLASRLTGWNLDILSESEYREEAFEGKDEELEAALLGHARAKAQGLTDAEALFSEFPDGPLEGEEGLVPTEGAAEAAPAEAAPEASEAGEAPAAEPAPAGDTAPAAEATEPAPEAEAAEAEPVAAEAPATDEATGAGGTEEPTAQEPTAEEPTAEKPAEEKPAGEGEAPAETTEGEQAQEGGAGEAQAEEERAEDEPKEDKPAGTIDAAKASQ